MSKLVKNILVYGLIAALVVVVAVLSVLLVKKDKPNNGETNGDIKFDCAYSNGEIGANDISIKFVSDKQSLLICGNSFYWGTYVTADGVSTITITEELDEEETPEEGKTETKATETDTDNKEDETTKKEPKVNILKFYNYGDKAILEETSEKDKLIEKAIAMDKQNGLKFNSTSYVSATAKDYILKLDDSTVFKSSNAIDTFKMKYTYVGNKIFFEYLERDSKIHDTSIYYIEKAGTHCKEINELGKKADEKFGEFKDKDLIYSVNGTTKEYFRVVETPKIEFEKLEYTSPMLSKFTFGELSEKPVTAKLSLTVNGDGTAKIVVTDNNDLKIDTTGIWHNLEDGLLILTNGKGFFGNYFSISFNNKENFKTSDAVTYVRANSEFEYRITWTIKTK